MNIEKIYKDSGAYLQGHFLLSSGFHSEFYLQSAKVLENPAITNMLAQQLAQQIIEHGLKVDAICSPAIGGLVAGYALAAALDKRFIFTERVAGEMELRRGFKVAQKERFIICEDIITTGGSALEAAEQIESNGGVVVGFASLANRGFCKRTLGTKDAKPNCKLPNDLPFFALWDFDFAMYDPQDCPLCKNGTKAYKPGSRGN